MISGGNATRSKRLGFKIRTIFCADLPFLHLLFSRCCPQDAVHILFDGAILLHLAFDFGVLLLQLLFLLGQLLILGFQGVEVGQLLKALFFQGLGRRFIENQGPSCLCRNCFLSAAR